MQATPVRNLTRVSSRVSVQIWTRYGPDLAQRQVHFLDVWTLLDSGKEPAQLTGLRTQQFSIISETMCAG